VQALDVCFLGSKRSSSDLLPVLAAVLLDSLAQLVILKQAQSRSVKVATEAEHIGASYLIPRPLHPFLGIALRRPAGRRQSENEGECKIRNKSPI
jgi:hypothetical protein